MLDWVQRTDDVPVKGVDVEMVASPAELEALAQELDLIEFPALTVTYHVRPLAKGRYLADGTVTADVVQSCVVTLDPVTNHIKQDFTLEFWPPDQIGEVPVDFDPLAEDEPEPLERGRIPIGRVVSEIVSLALPAFPRAPGAEIDEIELEPEDEDKPSSPFSALERLRKNRSE